MAARRCVGLSVGNERRMAAADAPSASESRMTATGTRVPFAHSWPSQTSGREMRCFRQSSIMGSAPLVRQYGPHVRQRASAAQGENRWRFQVASVAGSAGPFRERRSGAPASEIVRLPATDYRLLPLRHSSRSSSAAPSKASRYLRRSEDGQAPVDVRVDVRLRDDGEDGGSRGP